MEVKIQDCMFELEDERIAYLQLRKKYIDYSIKIEHNFRTSFNDMFGNFKALEERGLNVGIQMLDEAFQNAMDIIINNDILTIDEDAFFDNYFMKYFVNYYDTYNEVMEKYYSIVMEAEEYEEYRRCKKDNRARFVGGGFGVGGALKGAATAGALNIASGAAMGLMNLGLNFINKKMMEREVKNLYKNREEVLIPLSNGIRVAVYLMHLAIVDCLEDNGVSTYSVITGEDIDKCNAIAVNISRINDKEKQKKFIIEAFGYDQTNMVVWEKIDELFSNNKAEIGDMLKITCVEDDFFKKYGEQYDEELVRDLEEVTEYKADEHRYEYVSEIEQKWIAIENEIGNTIKEYKCDSIPILIEIHDAISIMGKEKNKYLGIYFSDTEEMNRNVAEFNRFVDKLKSEKHVIEDKVVNKNLELYVLTLDEWKEFRKDVEDSFIPDEWKNNIYEFVDEQIMEKEADEKRIDDALVMSMPEEKEGVVSFSSDICSNIIFLSRYFEDKDNKKYDKIVETVNSVIDAYWECIDKIPYFYIPSFRQSIECALPVLSVKYDNALEEFDKKIEEKQQRIYQGVKKQYDYLTRVFEQNNLSEYWFKLSEINKLLVDNEGGVELIDVCSGMSVSSDICEKGIVLRNYNKRKFLAYSDIKRFELDGKRVMIVISDTERYRLTDEKFKQYPDAAMHVVYILQALSHPEAICEGGSNALIDVICGDIEKMSKEELNNLSLQLYSFPDDITQEYRSRINNRIVILREEEKKKKLAELDQLCDGYEVMSMGQLQGLISKIKNFDNDVNKEHLKKVKDRYTILQREMEVAEISKIEEHLGEMSKQELLSARDRLQQFSKDLRENVLNAIEEKLIIIDKEEEIQERAEWTEKSADLENMKYEDIEELLSQLNNSNIHDSVMTEFANVFNTQMISIQTHELNEICEGISEASFANGLEIYNRLQNYSTSLPLKNSLLEQVTNHLIEVNKSDYKDVLEEIEKILSSKGIKDDNYGSISGIAIKAKYYNMIAQVTEGVNVWDLPLIIHHVEKALSGNEMYVLYTDCFAVITSKECKKYPLNDIDAFDVIKKMLSSIMVMRSKNGSAVEVKNNHGKNMDSCVSALNEAISILKRRSGNVSYSNEVSVEGAIGADEILQKTRESYAVLKKENSQGVIYFLRETDPKFDKRVLGATNSYACLSSDESILALCDTTLFGSGKEGFVLTTKNIYVSNIKDNKKSINLSDINKFVTEYIVKDKAYYIYAELKAGNRVMIPGKFMNAETLAVNSAYWLNNILEVIQ